MIQWLVLGGMVLVVLALLACWVGEVMSLNSHLDAADDEWGRPDRIDQRRD